MRKFIVLLSILLLMTSCAKNEDKPINDKVTEIENVRNVDMSGYQNMSDYNHNFKEITTEEMLTIINSKGSGVFYLGSTSCSMCQYAVTLLDKASKDTNVPIYYIDVYNEEDGFRESLKYVMDTLDEIILEYEGSKVIQTPHVFSVVDGEFYDSQVGLLETYDDSDEQKDLMVQRYKDILKPFIN